MGRFNFSWASGGILAPYLGGLLVEADLRLPFLVAMGLLTVTGLLMPLGAKLFSPMKDRQAPHSEQEGSAGLEASGPTPLRHQARLAGINAYFLTGALLFIFPIFAKETLGFSESLVGSFLLVRMAAATLGFELWGRWTFWHFRFSPLVLATLALIGLTLLFLGGSQLWQFYLLFAVVGLIFSFLYSYALFHGVAGSVHRERSMTIHEGALNIGLLSGTILGGWVSETWSMATVFVLCAAVSAGLLALQVVLTVLQRKPRS